MVTLRADDPAAVALAAAIRGGDLQSLERLLGERPGLAAARIVDAKGGVRTPLHIATDWPGHFPNGPAVVALLVRAGGDPNAPVEGSWHAETPLHWAASSDDVEVLDGCWTPGPRSRRRAPRSGAARRWTMRSRLASGRWPAGWWSAEPGPGCGTRPPWG